MECSVIQVTWSSACNLMKKFIELWTVPNVVAFKVLLACGIILLAKVKIITVYATYCKPRKF